MSNSKTRTPIAERIRRLLEQRQLSQAALAEKADLGAAVLSRLLAGDRTLRFEHLLAIARALEMTLADLVAETDAEAMLGEWVSAESFAEEARLRAEAQGRSSALEAELAGKMAELSAVRRQLEAAAANDGKRQEELIHLRAERDRLKGLTAEMPRLQSRLLHADAIRDGIAAKADRLEQQLGVVAAELLALRSAHRTARAQVATLQHQLHRGVDNMMAAGAIGSIVGGIVVALANGNDG